MLDLVHVVPGLIEKTHQGALNWEEPDLNEFEANLGAFKFLLRPAKEGWSLTLFNSEDRPLESVYSDTLNNSFIANLKTVDLAPLVEEVRRRARRVDESLAEVERLLRTL